MSLFGKLNNEAGREIPRPKTRFSQLFYIIKSNLFLVTMVSFINVIFILPLLGFCITLIFSLVDVYASGNPADIFSFGLTNCALLIPCFMIASIGVCGSYSLFKKIAFGEIFHFSDFFKGIKNNWYHFLIIGFVKGVSISLLVFSWLFYGYYSTQNLILVRILATTQYLILGPILIFDAGQVVTYNIKFIPKIRNSVILTIYGFLLNVLIFILRAIPLFLLLIAQTKLLLLISFILIFFGGAFYSLIGVLRSFALFDKLLHKNELSDYYRRGLRELQ